MSIGPFLELPNTAASRLREAAAREGIRVRVETPDSRAAEFYPGLYVFCSLLGRIQGRWRTSGEVCVFWLTFPRSHAFIPLLWPFESICRVAWNKCYLSLEHIEAIPNFDPGLSHPQSGSNVSQITPTSGSPTTLFEPHAILS
jgi:hypothetical protein